MQRFARAWSVAGSAPFTPLASEWADWFDFPDTAIVLCDPLGRAFWKNGFAAGLPFGSRIPPRFLRLAASNSSVRLDGGWRVKVRLRIADDRLQGHLLLGERSQVRAADAAEVLRRSGATGREIELYALKRAGATTREAARRLEIAYRTAVHHLENLYAKARVHCFDDLAEKVEQAARVTWEGLPIDGQVHSMRR